MTAHAPAQTLPIDQASQLAAEGVDEIRAEGKRGRGNKIDLSDPRVINKEVTVALARKISPDKIAEVIDGLINQTRKLKDDTEIPDVRAREAGVKLYLAYCVGLPVQRSEVINVNLDAEAAMGLEERLASSPALRRNLKAILMKVEAGADEERTS